MTWVNYMYLVCCSYVCIALASSIGYYPATSRSSEKGYGEDDSGSYADDKSKPDKYKGGRYYFGGKYTGKCGPDGLYYRDEYSFVLCSNVKGYVQPCAPGTRNSGVSDYAPGYYYGYSDFCDINLVDYGYSAPKYGPGYANKPSFGFAAYRNPASQSGYGRNSAEDKSTGYAQDSKGYQSENGGKNGYGQSSYNGQQSGHNGQQNGYNGYSDNRHERYEVPQRRGSGYQTQTGYAQH